MKIGVDHSVQFEKDKMQVMVNTMLKKIKFVNENKVKSLRNNNLNRTIDDQVREFFVNK